MKSIIDSGRIGDGHTVCCYIGQDWIGPHRGTWRVDPEISGGGQLYDTGSHLLDALLWVTGTYPESVTATVEYAEPGIDVSAALTARLVRDSRVATASIAVTDDGLYVEHQGATRYAVQTGVTTHHDAITRAKINHFVDAMTGRAEPSAAGGESVPVIALTEAAYRADERGVTVDVDELISEADVAAT